MLLAVCRKGDTNRTEPLAEGEHERLEAAFGKFGGSVSARRAAEPIVAKYQAMGSGRWFACDCRPDIPLKPVLTLVGQAHVRRHQVSPWPEHAEHCPFFREPGEQRTIVRRHRRKAWPSGYRLLRAFGERNADVDAIPRVRKASTLQKRSRLASLLIDLVDAAGLQTVDGPRPALGDQFRAIRRAAKEFRLDKDVQVHEFLCTYLDDLERFKENIQSSTRRWTKSRPHGILIVRIKSVERGRLIPALGKPLDVRGRIAVFGEFDGDRRPIAASGGTDARSPYLAIVLVGQAVAEGPIELVEAYVHPCVSDRDLMLVDSDLERKTLEQLGTLRDWLGRKKGISLRIEKPMFDIGPEPSGTEEEDGEPDGAHPDRPAPREVCIPDFIVRADPVPPNGATVVVVETMGFAGTEYRERKDRTHPAMSVALGGAPIQMHDFHEPAGLTQIERDDRFWKATRWSITGPERSL